MELLIFLALTTFGLILTLIGMRSTWVSVFAMLFNMIVFGSVMAGGLSETFVVGTETVAVTYESFPSILLPALFSVLSFIKIVRFR